MAIDLETFADRLRVSIDGNIPGGERGQLGRDLSRVLEAAGAEVRRLAPAAPSSLQDEATIRLGAWLWDSAPEAATDLTNGLELSGASALLHDFRVHRAGIVRAVDEIAAAGAAAGLSESQVTQIVLTILGARLESYASSLSSDRIPFERLPINLSDRVAADAIGRARSALVDTTVDLADPSETSGVDDRAPSVNLTGVAIQSVAANARNQRLESVAIVDGKLRITRADTTFVEVALPAASPDGGGGDGLDEAAVNRLISAAINNHAASSTAHHADLDEAIRVAIAAHAANSTAHHADLDETIRAAIAAHAAMPNAHHVPPAAGGGGSGATLVFGEIAMSNRRTSSDRYAGGTQLTILGSGFSATYWQFADFRNALGLDAAFDLSNLRIVNVRAKESGFATESDGNVAYAGARIDSSRSLFVLGVRNQTADASAIPATWVLEVTALHA